MNAQLRKRLDKLSALRTFDQDLLETTSLDLHCNFLGVIGIDEVGRGSLVGPVVAAAALFPSALSDEVLLALKNLDDSKATHLNHDKRLYLTNILKSHCFWGIGEASKEEVEHLNVAQASLLASKRSLMHLLDQFPQCPVNECLIVIDGRLKIRDLAFHQKAVVKADGLSASVASASVIAKAYRDSLLIEWAEKYPGYDWQNNAGYPTPQHKAALATLGATPLHRNTYKTVQKSLFDDLLQN